MDKPIKLGRAEIIQKLRYRADCLGFKIRVGMLNGLTEVVWMHDPGTGRRSRLILLEDLAGLTDSDESVEILIGLSTAMGDEIKQGIFPGKTCPPPESAS